LTSFDSSRITSGIFISKATSANATCTLDGSADSLTSGVYVCKGFEVKGFERITIALDVGDVGTAIDVRAEISLDGTNWVHYATAVDLDNSSDVIEIDTPISFVRIRTASTNNVAFLAEYQAVRR
jgi:hypothetical protein